MQELYKAIGLSLIDLARVVLVYIKNTLNRMCHSCWIMPELQKKRIEENYPNTSEHDLYTASASSLVEVKHRPELLFSNMVVTHSCL